MARIYFKKPDAEINDIVAALTPFQHDLWKKLKPVLDKQYAAFKIQPDPMPRQELDALVVPCTLNKQTVKPIPWDMRLLLAYDRNFQLWGSYADQPLFAPYFSENPNIYLPEFPIYNFISMNEVGAELGLYPFKTQSDPTEILHAVNTAYASLPTGMEMSQIGGEESPTLWFAEQANGCTPVLHTDYLRNGCLFDYVAQVMMQIEAPPYHAGADIPYIVDPVAYAASLEELKGKFTALRHVLDTVRIEFSKLLHLEYAGTMD